MLVDKAGAEALRAANWSMYRKSLPESLSLPTTSLGSKILKP